MRELRRAYPRDDERSGEVRAAHQPEPPVGVAALPPQRHHERMQPPHVKGVGYDALARTRARCANCVSTAAIRDVVRAKLASPQTPHPSPLPVVLHRLHVTLPSQST